MGIRTAVSKRALAFFIAAALVFTMLPLTAMEGGKANVAQAATHTNVSFATAEAISVKTEVSTVFDSDGYNNYFKFTLTTTSMTKIVEVSKSGFSSTSYYLYDVNQNAIGSSLDIAKIHYLNTGTYYLKIIGNRASGITQAALVFGIDQTAVGESFAEPSGGSNNTIATANAISLNKEYIGALAYYKSDPIDIYKFTIAYDSEVTIDSSLTAGLGNYQYVYFLKSNGVKAASTTVYLGQKKAVSLNKGTYYIQIGDSSSTEYNGGGMYKFKLTVKPKAVTPKSVSGKKGKVTIKWGKINGVTGYKVYRSLSSKIGGGSFKLIKTIKSAKTVKFTDKKATKKHKYYNYKIYAYKGSAKGAAPTKVAYAYFY